MCSGTWNSKNHSSCPAVFIRQQQQKKKPRVSVSVIILRRKRLRLRRRELRRAERAELEKLNLKLHLENRRILAENERLRERAAVLRRENLTLQANLPKTAVVVVPPAAQVTPGC